MAAKAIKTPLVCRGFALSHVGAVRQRNEDAAYVDAEGRFAVLADGMGGHLGGQEASRMAVSLMRNHLGKWFDAPAKDRAPLETFLRDRFVDTSANIFAKGQKNPELKHMGATLVVWVVDGREAVIAHSGDSRAYLFRSGHLYQMTPDHTMENEHILSGKTRSEVEKIPIRHVLSRNVGMMPATPPDVIRFPVEAGDQWLLCSDGLSNKLGNEEILWHLTVGRGSLPKAARGLVEHAFEAGGEDNITVCLMALDLRSPLVQTQDKARPKQKTGHLSVARKS